MERGHAGEQVDEFIRITRAVLSEFEGEHVKFHLAFGMTGAFDVSKQVSYL
jgi:hypothetical protein